MPFIYRTATQDYEKYIDDLLDNTTLATRNQCYTMTRAVFVVFRSHVAPQTAMDFAQSLPAVLRAIFVEDWDLSATIAPFPDHDTLTAEVRAVREAHNFSTPGAIAEVSRALRNAMKPEDYAFMITKLPPAAAAFWATD